MKLTNLSHAKLNGIFSAVDAMPDHLRLPYGEDMRDTLTNQDGEGIHNIVFCGMGGSALPGNLLKNWLYTRLTVPLEVCRGAQMPGYVNEHSLVIISSYSGDTAETLHAYEEAKKNNAQILIITNGGKLLEQAREQNCVVLELPECDQPRLAIFAGLRAITCAIQNMGLILIDVVRELEDTADFLNTAKLRLSPDIDEDNAAKKLAIKLAGKPVIVYASPLLASAAYIWKISFNEDAKQMAWYNTYSELDHNELEGWRLPTHKEFGGLQIVSQFEDKGMKKRIQVTTELIKEQGVVFNTMQMAGTTPLQELLYAVIFAGYTAGYCALLNGVDPEKVPQVQKLKAQLS